MAVSHDNVLRTRGEGAQGRDICLEASSILEAAETLRHTGHGYNRSQDDGRRKQEHHRSDPERQHQQYTEHTQTYYAAATAGPDDCDEEE